MNKSISDFVVKSAVIINTDQNQIIITNYYSNFLNFTNILPDPCGKQSMVLYAGCVCGYAFYLYQHGSVGTYIPIKKIYYRNISNIFSKYYKMCCISHQCFVL